MISFSRLGMKGNMGNQLFEIASVTGLAKQRGTQASFPAWQWEPYFANPLPHLHSVGAEVRERDYHYNPGQFSAGAIDINGWLQSYKYFPDNVRELFRFRDGLTATVRTRLAMPERKTICISIRRGDFVGNPNYFQLPVTYYILALLEHFPDWKQRNLLFLSDDLAYCRCHFSCLPNAYFAADLNPVEQLCAGATLCDDYIISNSTFSWWCAYLGPSWAKVIRPIKNMDGPLAERNSEKDYWPPAWIPYDHRDKKIPLADATFTIPVMYDHADRKQNTNLSVCLLQRDFDTNIHVMEQGGRAFEYMSQWCQYTHYEAPYFHRTAMLNKMAEAATTPYVVNWDCDTVLPPMRLWCAVDALRNGADMVYPFDGRVYHVPREPHFRDLERALDIGIWGDNEFDGKRGRIVISSVGHAVFVNRESFLDSGGENEYMISYGPEDCERWDRWHALKYDVRRVDGPMYHLEHWRGNDSSSRNPYWKANNAILEKVRMCAEQGTLRSYVETWPWHNQYTEKYYGTIVEGAISSAKIVAKELGFTPKSIIDIGCGLGEWSKGWPGADYIGVDYRVPQRRLLISPVQYIDHDLRKPFTISARFELALCLEVAEHIPEEHAARLVSDLCALSDNVLFSAAIPYQGGQGHINEQWQDWWGELFSAQGYGMAKVFRDVAGLEVWYEQNMVLYQKGASWACTPYVSPRMWLNVAGAK